MSDEASSIHLTIPRRLYVLPSAAIVVGSCIGIVRGSQRASLRFLAENAHRPPKTVKGWYLYNKTKNYRVILGGLREAGVTASKLGGVALGWGSIEEGLWRAGWGDVSEIGAGVGVAGLWSAIYRLGWKTSGRTLVVGTLAGCTMRMLRWGREELRERVG